MFSLGTRYLFGVFETPCPGARIAVQGSAVRVFPVTSDGDASKKATLRVMRDLPEYTSLYLPEDQENGKRVPWDLGAEHVVFAPFRPAGVSPRAVLGIQGSMLCDVTRCMVTAVFDLTDPERPRVRGYLKGGDFHVNVFAALDYDGDGELEYVAGPDGFSSDVELLRRAKSGAYVRELLFTAPSLICPC